MLTSDPRRRSKCSGGCGTVYRPGIPLKKGRFFSEDDRSDSPPVAIINETMARTYWPAEDALGKRFRFPGAGSNRWYAVVGVVGDMHRRGWKNV
jgi:MacB-like periplasmic core domain